MSNNIISQRWQVYDYQKVIITIPKNGEMLCINGTPDYDTEVVGLIGNGINNVSQLYKSWKDKNIESKIDKVPDAANNNIAVFENGNIKDSFRNIHDFVPDGDKGNPDGVATLDHYGNVPFIQLGNMPSGSGAKIFAYISSSPNSPDLGVGNKTQSLSKSNFIDMSLNPPAAPAKLQPGDVFITTGVNGGFLGVVDFSDNDLGTIKGKITGTLTTSRILGSIAHAALTGLGWLGHYTGSLTSIDPAGIMVDTGNFTLDVVPHNLGNTSGTNQVQQRMFIAGKLYVREVTNYGSGGVTNWKKIGGGSGESVKENQWFKPANIGEFNAIPRYVASGYTTCISLENLASESQLTIADFWGGGRLVIGMGSDSGNWRESGIGEANTNNLISTTLIASINSCKVQLETITLNNLYIEGRCELIDVIIKTSLDVRAGGEILSTMNNVSFGTLSLSGTANVVGDSFSASGINQNTAFVVHPSGRLTWKYLEDSIIASMTIVNKGIIAMPQSQFQDKNWGLTGPGITIWL